MNTKEKGRIPESGDAPNGLAGKARILVVDDHPIVREGLAALINRQSDVVCCGCASGVMEAQNAIVAQKPHVVLLDLRLGSADGLESIKILKAQFPNTRILVISQFDEAVYAERALRAGALGYLMKEQATEEVLRAVRTVLAGQIYVSPKAGTMAMMRILQDKSAVRDSDIGLLTDRELHVFNSVGAGKSNKEIAGDLNLSVKTIETYRDRIKLKFGMSTGAELVQYARRSAMQGAATAS